MNEHFPDHEKLREDLREVLGEPTEPSAELRASVLEYADRRGRRSRAPRWRISAAAATLAAAAAVVLMVSQQPAPEIEPEPASEALPMDRAPHAEATAEKMMMRAAPVAIEGDLNRDGRVDILDAWRLSRAIGAAQDRGDLDADGEVSPDDLETLMQRIVTVRGGAS